MNYQQDIESSLTYMPSTASRIKKSQGNSTSVKIPQSPNSAGHEYTYRNYWPNATFHQNAYHMTSPPDKIFREGLGQYQKKAPPSAWDRIEKNLDQKKNNF